MANRDCNGDFFTTEHGRHYRCMWDGTVITSGTLLDDKCPNCKRMIDATELDHVETRIATQFKHPSFGWCDLSWELIPAKEQG